MCHVISEEEKIVRITVTNCIFYMLYIRLDFNPSEVAWAPYNDESKVKLPKEFFGYVTCKRKQFVVEGEIIREEFKDIKRYTVGELVNINDIADIDTKEREYLTEFGDTIAVKILDNITGSNKYIQCRQRFSGNDRLGKIISESAVIRV